MHYSFDNFKIEDNHVVKYIPLEDYKNTIMAQKRLRPQIYHRTKKLTRGKFTSQQRWLQVYQNLCFAGVLVVGALSGDPAKFTKDYCGLFTSSGVHPKKKLARFPVSDNAIIQPGTRLRAAHFQAGQYLDIIGRGYG